MKLFLRSTLKVSSLIVLSSLTIVSFQNCAKSSLQSDSSSGSLSDGSSIPTPNTPPPGSGSTTTPATPNLPSVTLTGGSKPVAFPFNTWTGATVAVSPSTTGKTYYVDGKTGSDSNAGTSANAALKTIKASILKVAAGDTVLIKSGLYREILDMSGISGTSGKPITFGSYGDGEVKIDGSTAVTGWTKQAGSVWKATVTNGSKINAVIVNEKTLNNYKTTKAIPASGSDQWYFDGASTLYADMGAVDPTTANADILVVRYSHGDSTIFLGASSYLNLIGLTIRGSGWAGVWSYPASAGGENVTVAYCDIKFNDGAGLVFTGGVNNSALYNRVYHNVLNNWPFGANGNGVAGGGWPGSLAWAYEVNPLARGNVVSLNGGEGIISYGNGTSNGHQTGNTLFEQNVSYDNWSMNSYVDNQPNHVIRNNLFYRHTPDKTWMWDQSDTYTMEKFRVCLALADEYGSGSPAGTAAMANAQVYNNIMVGCRYGITDYNESTTGHGMKNDLIVNNTIFMDNWNYTQEPYAGILISNNGANNSGTVIANNIIYRPTNCPSVSCPLIGTQGSAKLSGIAFNRNLYFAVGNPNSSSSLFSTNLDNGNNAMSFSGWQSFQGIDSASVYADPLFVDAAGIQASASPDYTKAGIGANSPAKGLANSQSNIFLIDFAGFMRGATWSAGALQ